MSYMLYVAVKQWNQSDCKTEIRIHRHNVQTLNSKFMKRRLGSTFNSAKLKSLKINVVWVLKYFEWLEEVKKKAKNSTQKNKLS